MRRVGRCFWTDESRPMPGSCNQSDVERDASCSQLAGKRSAEVGNDELDNAYRQEEEPQKDTDCGSGIAGPRLTQLVNVSFIFCSTPHPPFAHLTLGIGCTRSAASCMPFLAGRFRTLRIALLLLILLVPP